MSVSINIMDASPSLPFLSQYRFDVKKCEIAGILTRTATEALLALAANHGGGNGRDLVESFAARHPCDRIQFAALRELAAAEADIDAGLELLGRGRRLGRCLRRGDERARKRADRGEPGWIER